MEANFTFAPKGRTLRKFDLIETNEFFLLIGTDKLTKTAHIIHLNRLQDTKQDVKLSDVIKEGSQALNPK